MKNKTAIFIGLFITIVFAVLMLLKLSPLETLEEKLLDYRFITRGTISPPDNIVIAAIDEKSIEKLGRWPWDRDRIAMLVDKLNNTGAGIIVFDIIYSEKEKNDLLLGNAINNAGNVLMPIVFDFERDSSKPENEVLLNSAFVSIENPEMFNKYNPIMAKSALMPVDNIIKNVMGLGHINMFPDSDGTLRWESLIIGYKGYLYPSITLQAAAFYLGIPHEKIVVKATEGIRFGKRFIPTDRWGRMLINYYGSNQTFKHISISDILEDKISQEEISGKIVLIGATAVGIYDLRVTPFSPAMPGIEKHASVIASILENRFLKASSKTINLIILFLSGSLFSILIPRFKATGASVVTGITMMLILLSGYYLFVKNGLWINISYPLINILFTFMGVTAYNYAVEEKHARKIRAMFSSYVTEKVVNELIKNPDMAKLGGERREVTVLFSDVRGFTSLSEKHSPEEVVAILNEYLGEMTDIIFRWEGTLDKFIGDAILAFWGAPMPQPNHAELAVKCALNMIKRLEELQQKWKAEGKPVLDCGIGINTGEVLVGNIGAEGKKMDYTVIGDHVNLGSRIEGLTRKYNVHILITEFTLEKIKDLVAEGRLYRAAIEGLEKVAVKGKERPVEIYEIRSLQQGEESKITECREEVVVMKEK
ncbi:adenylate/guanylate cyclase domain-containing protein [Dissulfurispira thermophila]|uniref:Adenylate/guanylate cyclase domain-containing protein n=1 Tax=Dissulfurispira thermophila TaxID=2715679 RepID=A0A7G1H6S3_9BACT|nr:adenylate/guanylate cyclase domain-containing protein [Dissulfurispira thermophila]BCB97457.1 adenylate/guanylate cyclase domain-containing protein [Dissulfurispira thermophila]